MTTQAPENIASSNDSIITVLLAAGASSRFGGCKLTAQLNNQSTLLAHGLHLINQACMQQHIAKPAVIIGAHINDDIIEQLHGNHILVNENWQQGLSSSIKVAVEYAQSCEASALMLVLADQVCLTTADYVRLIEQYRSQPQTSCAVYQHNLGVPAIFVAADFDSLNQLTGDVGAKSILKQKQNLNCLNMIVMDQASVDIDTPADLTLWLETRSE